MKCSICGKPLEGYGHSPSPLNASKCCDECNNKIVLPIRLFLRTLEAKTHALLIKENEVKIVKPDYEYFTLKELQTAVDGYIELAPSLFRDYIDVVNEEGLLKKLYFNKIAYLLMDKEYVGNVLIVPKAIFEKPEED